MNELSFVAFEKDEDMIPKRKKLDLGKLDMLVTDGDGQQYLADDGQYKPVSGLSPEERAKLEAVELDGAGDKYLANNGQYQTVSEVTAADRQKLNMLKTNGSPDEYLAGNGQYRPLPECPVINYSLTEQDTGLKWIDGRKIYQKTVELIKPTKINTYCVTPHNISNMDHAVDYKSSWITYDGGCGTLDAIREYGGKYVFYMGMVSRDGVTLYTGDTSALPGNYTCYTTIYYVCTDR